MFAFLGHWEMIAVLVIVLLLFGHRIPGMARALGSGISEFKRGLKTGESEDRPESRPDGGAKQIGDKGKDQ
jgi:sec-independent protein translocase protein TatA